MKLADYMGKAKRMAKKNPLSLEDFDKEMEIARAKFRKELRNGKKGELL